MCNFLCALFAVILGGRYFSPQLVDLPAATVCRMSDKRVAMALRVLTTLAGAEVGGAEVRFSSLSAAHLHGRA